MSAIPLFPETATETIRNELEETLQLQRAAYFAHPVPSFAERKADLLKLQAMLRDHREAILDAISADYGNRSRHETLFAEIFGVMDGVDHTLKHLKLWMKPQTARRGLAQFLWRQQPGHSAARGHRWPHRALEFPDLPVLWRPDIGLCSG